MPQSIKGAIKNITKLGDLKTTDIYTLWSWVPQVQAQGTDW